MHERDDLVPGNGGKGRQVMAEQAQVTGKISVFLLDDHEIVRRDVREMLEAETDITVVGEAGTAASALARIPGPAAERRGSRRAAARRRRGVPGL
jgi:hypothetical protein